jgi:hypothetical protein
MCLANVKKVESHSVIKAYKVLAIHTYKYKEEIYSPYYSFEWEIGKEMTVDLINPFTGENEPVIGKKDNTISEGMFHSLRDYFAARAECNDLHFSALTGRTKSDKNGKIFVLSFDVFEVEIPEDAVLYDGDYGFYVGYASNKMKIVKRVENVKL